MNKLISRSPNRKVMKRVCVFCGSNQGARPVYDQIARAVGTTLARRGLEVVYGGGRVGLMGAVADSAMEAGGTVIGVIPDALFERELGHQGLTDLRVVSSMHERKALMAELSDGFIALPGGFGTFEEFCEILTWAQLGLHSKPCGIVNADGYYDSLLDMIDYATKEEFVHPDHRSLILVEESVEDLLDVMINYSPPKVAKWIDREET